MRRTGTLAAVAAAVLATASLASLAGADSPPAGSAIPESFAPVAARVRPAVVVVRTPPVGEFSFSEPAEYDHECEDGDEACPGPDGFREFLAGFIRALQGRTLASGAIVDPAGLVVTSARAVLLSRAFEVVLSDGTPLPATIVGLDRRSDVAVLKITGGPPVYPSLAFGDSSQMRPGDWVLGVGAPHGLAGTVTAGVVTAVPLPGVASAVAAHLMTDAVLGRGGAGGPLVNRAGEIVGINTVADGGRIGLALPSNVARPIYLELAEKGRVSRPWLGASTQSLTSDLARLLGTPGARGVLVTDVVPGGPAARAGLRAGDVVVQVDQSRIESRGHLDGAVRRGKPGQVVRLRALRRARPVVAEVRLGEEPDDWRLPPAQARARRLLGIQVRPITSDMGVVIDDVEPGSPANGAGIDRGDVVREVDRVAVRRMDDFETAARALRPGAVVLVLVQRGPVAVYVAVRAAPE
jgi:S1-C subfamily serine protease